MRDKELVMREYEHDLLGIIPRSHFEMWGFYFPDLRL